jgi:5-formyltetrahydrofolate cyclo-ligase
MAPVAPVIDFATDPLMAEPGTSSLEARKRQARSLAKVTRAEAAVEDPVATGYALCERVLAAVEFPGGCVVSAYWPIGSEIDPRPLITHLHEDGHPIALPVIQARGDPLVFRAWRPEDRLEPAAFDTRVPLENQPELTPRVLIVPLLAFDRAGYRLGYGGGFYDRTLARLRESGAVLAVGVAYAAQEVAQVPRDGTDQPLDWIVTEAETIRVGMDAP